MGTRGKEFPGGKTDVQEVPVQGPCFLRDIQVKSFSEDDEGGPGRALRMTSGVWSRRSYRPGLLGSESAYRKEETRSLTWPRPWWCRIAHNVLPEGRMRLTA